MEFNKNIFVLKFVVDDFFFLVNFVKRRKSVIFVNLVLLYEYLRKKIIMNILFRLGNKLDMEIKVNVYNNIVY